MARQTREQLGVKEGDQIILKGVVTFAKLDKPIEGEALMEENARRAKLGIIKADSPFRSITIEKPEIIQGKGSPLANYYGQLVYNDKKTNTPRMSFESKSQFPPQYGHIQNGEIVEIPDPQKNPATGQVVYLLLKAYKAKGFANLGSTFNAIVFEEGPIQYYEGVNSLAGFGEALGMSVKTLSNEEPKEDTGFGNQPIVEPEQPANPFGMQDDEVAGGNPFGSSGQRGNSPFA